MRVAANWSGALAQSSTVRVSAPIGQVEAQVQAVLGILATTPGVATARELTEAEQHALLEPWFGPDLPLDTLPVIAGVRVMSDPFGWWWCLAGPFPADKNQSTARAGECQLETNPQVRGTMLVHPGRPDHDHMGRP